jgi:hypothetical protein
MWLAEGQPCQVKNGMDFFFLWTNHVGLFFIKPQLKQIE